MPPADDTGTVRAGVKVEVEARGALCVRVRQPKGGSAAGQVQNGAGDPPLRVNDLGGLDDVDPPLPAENPVLDM